MSDADLRARADERLERALETHAVLDPRPFLRDRLRRLKEQDARAFERALRWFEEELVPRAADPAADPIEAWIAYGRLLGEAASPGRALALDPTGRARPFEPPAPSDALVLYLPDDPASPALPLRVPASPSPPQRAAFELLVEGRVA